MRVSDARQCTMIILKDGRASSSENDLFSSSANRHANTQTQVSTI